jgi:hypothetical protein
VWSVFSAALGWEGRGAARGAGERELRERERERLRVRRGGGTAEPRGVLYVEFVARARWKGRES